MSLPTPSGVFPLVFPLSFPLEPRLGRGRPLEHTRGFASPLTRIVLSSEGQTTTLLESMSGESLRLRCLAQLRVTARETGEGVAALLRTPEDTGVLVRHTATTRTCGEPLSVNHVVARLDLEPAIEHCLTSTSVPLGRALTEAGTGHRRTLLETGRRPWGQGGDNRPACFKTYLVWHRDLPLVLINELFNPSYVPAG
ncbi:hypothetical protein RM844_13045 [Streptomyces sp. DSM 44915]|uniref:Chorismate lyase n=1 Tax=Streptomyces chisholmiae TaxID=3075540 RepID=A0ABU2JQG0_9ACTN|nr:hypothetical protein [Streptomyces sp. DSM 44915]MDT0267213.1 hypothetical protein [Streptomyces sp. DSM 44915]